MTLRRELDVFRNILLLLPVISLVTLSSPWVVEVAATSDPMCEWLYTNFSFKPSSMTFGQESWITSPYDPKTVAPLRAIPPIVIEARNVFTKLGLEWNVGDQPVQVTATFNPSLRLAGGSVALKQGQAIFEDLTVMEEPPRSGQVYNLVFTARFGSGSDGGSDQQAITVRQVAVLTTAVYEGLKNDPHSLSFANKGFFRGGNENDVVTPKYTPIITPADVTANRIFPVPPFWIQVKNIVGEVIQSTVQPTSSGGSSLPLSVRVSRDSGTAIQFCASSALLCVNQADTNRQDTATIVMNSGSIEINNLHIFLRSDAVLPPSGEPDFRLSFDLYRGTTLVTNPDDDDPQVQTDTTKGISSLARNKFMLFDTKFSESFFNYDNEGGKSKIAVLGIPLPQIRIHMLTSKMTVDRSLSGAVIRATSAAAELTGAETVVAQGVATFSSLAFASSTALPASFTATITFISSDATGSTTESFVLSSGDISVVAVPPKSETITFAKSSFLHQSGVDSSSSSARPQKPLVRLVQNARDQQVIKIPSFKLTVLDGANQFDSTVKLEDRNFVLRNAPGEGGDTVTSGFSASFTSGIGVMDESNSATEANNEVVWPNTHSTLSVDVKNAIDGGSASIFSEQLKVVDASSALKTTDSLISTTVTRVGCDEPGKLPEDDDSCYFFLSFANPAYSFVYSSREETFATLLNSLPEIVIRLENDFYDNSITPPPEKPVIKVFTGDSPETEQFLAQGGDSHTQVTGVLTDADPFEYSFKQVTFLSVPPSLKRLKFAAYHPTTGRRLNQIPILESGFVSVAEEVTPKFALRFSSSTDAPSLITFPNQDTSAVLNIDLPQVVVEVVNSNNQLDTTANDIVISAIVDGGSLDEEGRVEKTVNGRAFFQNLRFSEVPNEPIIEFRARQSIYPVSGKGLKTGFITVTRNPIPTYSLAISPTIDATNDIPRTYWKTDAEAFKIAIQVVNSAHQKELAVSGVSIESFRGAISDGSEVLRTDETVSSLALFSKTIRPGESRFFTFKATTATAGLLNGKTITIGPITNPSSATAVASGGTGTASTGTTIQRSSVDENDIGVVKLKYSIPVATFINSQESRKSQLAVLVGVSTDRLQFFDIESTTGIDHVTLQPWTGTKVTVQFLAPLSTGITATTKTPKQLADQVLALRPKCEAQALSLQEVFLPSQDTDCKPTVFETSMTSQENCEANFGLCACYNPLDSTLTPTQSRIASGFVIEVNKCWREPRFGTEIVNMCSRIAGCGTVDIDLENVCGQVLQVETRSLWWIIAPICGGLGLFALVLFLRSKGYLRGREKPKASRGPDGGLVNAQ